MLNQTQLSIKIIRSLVVGFSCLLFFQANLAAQTILGSISGSGSNGCSVSFTVNEGSIIRLTPTDEVDYNNFVWYYDNITPANQIDSLAAASGKFYVDPATRLPLVLVRTPFGSAQALRYILTSNIASTGCVAKHDTIYLNVAPIAPVANPDYATAKAGVQINLPILVNDYNSDGTPTTNLSKITTPKITSLPQKGTAVVNQDGSISYAPNITAKGSDTLIYQICNVHDILKCDTAIVTIDITPHNEPPVAVNDFATTKEDIPVSGSVSGNDYDSSGNLDTLSYFVYRGPSKGSIILGPNGSYTYTPAPNFYGKDTIYYRVCDTGFPIYCDSALLLITVEPVNDPPMAIFDFTNTPEDTPVNIAILDNDLDLDGNMVPATITFTMNPKNGKIIVDKHTGIMTYTPNPGFHGLDSLIYQVCDDGVPLPGLCDTALVVINVMPVAGISIINYVWFDADRDGERDVSENPVGGVSFELISTSNIQEPEETFKQPSYDLGPMVVDRATSVATGRYAFYGVQPGKYIIRAVRSTLPPGYQVTIPKNTVSNLDSDFNPFSLLSSPFNIDPVNMTIQFVSIADLGLVIALKAKKVCGPVQVRVNK